MSAPVSMPMFLLLCPASVSLLTLMLVFLSVFMPASISFPLLMHFPIPKCVSEYPFAYACGTGHAADLGPVHEKLA